MINFNKHHVNNPINQIAYEGVNWLNVVCLILLISMGLNLDVPVNCTKYTQKKNEYESLLGRKNNSVDMLYVNKPKKQSLVHSC